MKREQRQVYLELSSEIDAQLCVFCKHGESQGCCDGMACIHPLNEEGRLVGEYDGITPNEDCFLFYPAYSIDFIADIVSIILSQGFDEWFFYKNKKGQTIVKGEKLHSYVLSNF